MSTEDFQRICVKKCRFRRLGTLLCGVLSIVLVKNALGQSATMQPGSERIQERVATILDNSKPDAERSAAYSDLFKEAPDECKVGLRELLRSADEEFSLRAAISLLGTENVDQEVEELIVKRIPRWGDGHRRELLSRHGAGKNSPGLRFIPRAVLQAVIDGKIDPPQNVIVGSVDYATRIVAFAHDAQDETLVQRAVLACPYSRSLWLALGRRGPLPPDHAKLASDVIGDASRPYLARVAAAGALAQIEAEASRFAHAEIRAFLDEFGPLDMTIPPWPSDSGGTVDLNKLSEERIQFSQKETRYAQRKSVLGNLLNLDTPEAERLIFQYLLAPNPRIRRALAIVAVKRWPMHFLDDISADTYPTSEPQEYEMYLSLIAYLHPNLRKDVEDRIGVPMVQKLFHRIEGGAPIWWCEEVGAFLKGW
jgi:hypothetical protein